jgi:biopolymer transport protein TolQ
MEGEILGGSGTADLSLISLFLRADFVVQLVLMILLAASIWSWAIIVEKFRRMRRLSEEGDRFEEAFWSGGSLEDLYDLIVRVGHA